MKNSIMAPLFSALVLPGLGQIINRQYIKGIILIGAATVLFLTVLIKVLIDFSAVMGQVMGPDMQLGADKWSLIAAGMRERGFTFIMVLLVLGAAIWLYSVIDAYHFGRLFKPSEEE